MRTCSVFSLVLFLTGTGVTLARTAASAPADMEVLATLHPAHPRLMVTDQDIQRIRQLIATDVKVRELRDALHHEAVQMLDAPPVEYKIIGLRLLQQSRLCLTRVSILAGLYRLEGDLRFAKRAEQEMLTAAAFPDWNPSHFLDTAEMANALGIGYDWLYDAMPADSRRAIRTAILDKGLKPGLDVYRKRGWWTVRDNNWNQVCNGGLTVGALAIADEEPVTSAEILRFASKSIPLAMHTFSPDGGCPEGPTYWNYAMRYTAYYWAALNTALGNDFSLKQSPGFADTGLFLIHCLGPTGLTFNYADSITGVRMNPQMMYFARQFDRPAYAAMNRHLKPGNDILNLLWYDARGSDDDIVRLPLSAWFQHINVVFMRSKWNDPQAMFVGFKGGNNAASHSHLDLGTFVLDALGERWAIDLGMDDYGLPGYFGKQRWDYYRLKTEGHNCLLINGENQETTARAPVLNFNTGPGSLQFAIVDLSAGYAQHAKRLYRGINLREHRVVVQDEIELTRPAEIVWAMHTQAQIEADGPNAELSLNGRRLHARLIEPVGAAWSVQDVHLDPPQFPAENVRKLLIRLDPSETSARIIVSFSTAPTPSEQPIEPLKSWGLPYEPQTQPAQ